MLQIQTIGYLGKDAVISNYDGKQVINFSVANTEKFLLKDGSSTEQTHWIECSYWAESKVWQYLKKGTLIFIQGALTVNLYDMPSGDKNYRINARINKVEIISSKPDQTTEHEKELSKKK
jgi:single-strand DNA-binding protein